MVEGSLCSLLLLALGFHGVSGRFEGGMDS